MKRDWVLIVSVVLVAASTVIASFTAQAGLGLLAGWKTSVDAFGVELRLSWLLPLTVDAYGIGATRIATNKRAYSAEVRRHAFGHALAAVAVSVVANAVFHLIEAGVIVLGSSAWLLVVAVSIVPPVALGGLAHLLSIAARDEIESADGPHTTTVVPRPTVATVTDVTPVPEAVPGVPATVGESPTVEVERVGYSSAISSPIGESEPFAEREIAVPLRFPFVVPAVYPPVPVQVAPVPDAGKSNTSEPVEHAGTEGQVHAGTAVPEHPPIVQKAVEEFAETLRGGQTPPVREIKARLGVGTDRAREVRVYLDRLATSGASS
ncbi:hypothetical protein FHU36_008439 [Nonomuraea muscovyensis]|uniref:DUF2637 domain-containing protein n=1 Tax=Nonomuraea muscovyensis TaxID=1124761 RepID=A0A7X0CCY4_9ACTN|nr:DUF2637 domain-containing protein [Nonomuraea muscovyensis]MBB6351856.1 hypothetical protein [Nonomuraea muscovyensis]